MGIGDWFLSRSEAFRLLMMKFRDHKHDTIQAFSKVRKKHSEMDRRLIMHEAKLRELSKLLLQLKSKVESNGLKVVKVTRARKKR